MASMFNLPQQPNLTSGGGNKYLETLGNNASSTASNLVLSKYRDMIENIRGELNGQSVHHKSVTDKKTAEYYLKVKALNALLQVMSIYKDNVEEEKTKEYYKKDVADTTALMVDDANYLDKLWDKEVEDYYKDLNKKTDKNINDAKDSIKKLDVDNRVYYGLKLYDKKLDLLRTGHPEFKNIGSMTAVEILSEAERKLKEMLSNSQNRIPKGNNNSMISDEHRSVGLESTKETFPKLSEPVKTQNTEIAKKISSIKEFSVKTRDGKVAMIPKSWVNVITGKPDDNTTYTPTNTQSNRIESMMEAYRNSVPGTVKFFIEKLHGHDLDGKFYKRNNIISGATRNDMPNRMIFHAFIDKFNDSYDVSSSEHNFYGRSEGFHIYSNTKRNLSFGFTMISDYSSLMLLNAINLMKKSLKQKGISNVVGSANISSLLNNIKQSASQLNNPNTLSPQQKLDAIRRNLPNWGLGGFGLPTFVGNNPVGGLPGYYSMTPSMLWNRMTFLAQTCYPYYRRDGKMKEQPIIRVRIGDWLDVTGMIKSLVIDNYEEGTIDFNPSSLGMIPLSITVTITMDIIHMDEPSSDYSRFYHRKEFDSMPYGGMVDDMSETSETNDSVLETENDKGKTIDKLKDKARKKNEELKRKFNDVSEKFNNKFNDLKDFPKNQYNLAKRDKTKVAVKTAAELNNINDQINMINSINKLPEEYKSIIDKYSPEQTEINNSPLLNNVENTKGKKIFQSFKENI